MLRKHVTNSDDFYQQGNIGGAVEEFYAAYSPHADTEELKIITNYLSKVVQNDKTSPSQDEIHCLVFSVSCKEKAEEVHQIEDHQHELEKGWQSPWIFDVASRINVRFVKEESLSMLN